MTIVQFFSVACSEGYNLNIALLLPGFLFTNHNAQNLVGQWFVMPCTLKQICIKGLNNTSLLQRHFILWVAGVFLYNKFREKRKVTIFL